MDRLKRNIGFIGAFKNASPTQAKALLKNITQDQSQVLGDIAANLLNRTLTLSSKGKQLLKEYKDFVFCIGNKETTHTRRLNCIKKHPQQALRLIEVTAQKLERLCNIHKKKKRNHKKSNTNNNTS